MVQARVLLVCHPIPVTPEYPLDVCIRDLPTHNILTEVHVVRVLGPVLDIVATVVCVLFDGLGWTRVRGIGHGSDHCSKG